MNYSLTLFVALILCLSTAFASDSDEIVVVASRVVELEHAMRGNEFKSRGTFTIQMNADGNMAVVNMDNFGITDDMADDFKELLRTGGHYKLRMRSSSEKNAPYVQTAMPACNLQKSGFKEDIALFVSADESLTIRGTSYNSPVIGLARPCDPNTLKTPAMFLTRIKMGENQKTLEVPLQASGSKPYYLGHVQIESTYVDADGKTKTKSPDPQASLPWYRKYWYVLLAAFMIMRMSGAEPPSDEKKKKE